MLPNCAEPVPAYCSKSGSYFGRVPGPSQFLAMASIAELDSLMITSVLIGRSFHVSVRPDDQRIVMVSTCAAIAVMS